MGIKENLKDSDVYIDYNFDDVMFRYDGATKKFYCKFYGETGETEVPFNQKLLTDALIEGVEVDKNTYDTCHLRKSITQN
jgi:hypothetical protein